MSKTTDILPYSALVSIIARELVDASAAAIKAETEPDADPLSPAEAEQARVSVASSLVPKVMYLNRAALGAPGAVEEQMVFSMMAVALSFVSQPLPPLLARRTDEATFGRDVRAKFDELLGYKHDAPAAPDDDGDIVWALFFDDDGCGPSAVSLTPKVLDFPRRPGEPEPKPGDLLSRNIMIGVDLSPSEFGPQFVETGGFALKVPAAERLIAKLRMAIDQPRDPRLDAPATTEAP